jgi:AraC-like DNA-binding protein
MLGSEILISTDLVDSHIRNDYWREVSLPYAEILSPSDMSRHAVIGSLQSTSWFDGQLMVVKTKFNSQHYKRSENLIKQCEFDFFTLQLITQGTMQGHFGSRNVNAQVGDICIVDMAKTFEHQASDGSRIYLTIPRKALAKIFKNQDLHGLVLKAGHPITGMLSNFIVAFSNINKPLEIHDVNAINEATISLLASIIDNSLKESPETILLLNSTIYDRALEFIDAHILSPELSPELVQSALRISRAHLYRAFAYHGGIAKVIRDKRLDLAYQELISIQSSKQITQLAYDCGFSSGDQFLKAFRKKFSITPSEVKGQKKVLVVNDSNIHQLHNYFLKFKNNHLN